MHTVLALINSTFRLPMPKNKQNNCCPAVMEISSFLLHMRPFSKVRMFLAHDREKFGGYMHIYKPAIKNER